MLNSGSFSKNSGGEESGVNDSGSSVKSHLKSPTGRRLGFCSQIATGGVGQQTSPVVFPEKRSKKIRTGSKKNESLSDDTLDSGKVEEFRIDIGAIGAGTGGDEKSDLLGDVVISGKLVWDKRRSADNDNRSTEITSEGAVDARLTSKALLWGSHQLLLDDVISVSYNVGLRHFTVHAYPLEKGSCFRSCFAKHKRLRKDYRFLATTVDEAIQWVGGFADQHCYVNCLPHPLVSSKKQASSELLPTDPPPELIFRCKNPPKMLVILNPRSGRGRSIRVFNEIAEPILKLAGFNLEVVKTTSAGHAKELASSVDISTCPDGIICVGGDGIINEVLNGLLCRENQKEGISLPIGIIPAGSDNSLVWTVLGVKDPISAAIAIVKGGLTATDVFAVEWIQTGVRHFGMTVSYYGFVSDVLEQCEKYQKRFGPLRYFVSGFLKFLFLPKYSYEVEFLPAQKENLEATQAVDKEVVDVSEIYSDYMRKSIKDGLPRASSLSSIDSIMSPNQVPGGDLETNANSEPSDYVRGLDPRIKRLSTGKNNPSSEPEVIHPQLHLSTTPNWPRTRSKSKTDRGWSGLTVTQDLRSSWGNTTLNDREDISSTLSDPGPIWDAEPKWESDPNWDVENWIQLPGPSVDLETNTSNAKKEVIPRFEDKLEFRKGQFLGILVCNHACRTVQSSQVVAPQAQHDDYTMDLILVHGSGRLRLLRFFLLLQMGRHTSLPFVEYVKVKSVKIKALKHTHNGCGIDGELFPLNGPVFSFLLPEQCRLIGRSSDNHI